MFDILFWLYLVTATLLINHEIDSAYWKEWDLFHMRGGVAAFLIIHLPLVFLTLYGLVLLLQHTFAGLLFSFLLSCGGIFAFIIHQLFIKKGATSFKTPVSQSILIATLIVSFLQAVATIYTFFFEMV